MQVGYIVTPLGSPPVEMSYCAKNPAVCLFLKIASIAAVSASVYHGYKRNQRVGSAIWWGLGGAIAPVITIPVAIAQGYGQPRKV